ncbi:MAG: GEVED domain-containing protein, partial [Bacteroidota bacterium]
MRNLNKIVIAVLLILTAGLFSSTSIKAQQILNNNKLRFGNGAEQSVNNTGNLQQPFYYNGALSLWRKLTYSSYPLDNAFALNGVGTSEWNVNGNIVLNPAMTGQSIDVSGFIATSGNNGYGTIISTGTINIGGQNMEVTTTYILPQNNAFIKVTTRIKNTSSSAMSNVRYWIGTRDDWVGATDAPRKQKGNLVGGAFVQNSLSSDKSLALKISTGAEGVLFYTTTNKANIVTYCCYNNFISNVVPQNPATSPLDITSDGAYGMYVRMNDLAVNSSDEFSWYYAAGELANLEQIIAQVASASGAVSEIMCSTATFKATTSATGTGYWMAVPHGSTAPTANQIKSGGNYGSVTIGGSSSATMTANVEHTFYLSGLSNNTNYDLYFVSEDATPAFSTIAVNNFTTMVYGSPTVTTTAISAITPTSASSGGNAAISCETITARGVCWNTTGNPTIADSVSTNGTGPGNFASSLTGLTVGTTYYVRAYATNSVGTGYGSEVTFVASLSFCTPAASTNACTYMSISNVTTTGGTTNFNNSSACTSSSYTNYSSSNSVSQTQGSNVNMSLSSTGYPLHYSVWVDYNNDGIFATTEQVIAYNNSAASMTVNTSFTIPSNAPIGSHRMRVRGDYYGVSIPTDPCATLQYGETEDYSIMVNISGPSNPTSVSASSNTICYGTSTTLTCNGAAGTVYWYTGSCGGTQVSTGNTFNASPAATTTYYARNYSNGNFSLGCASITVTVNPLPTITCPGNQSAYSSSSSCNATVTYSSSSTGTPTPSVSYSFSGATT